jgi:DNA-binding transcriptional MerR regulator
MEYTVNKLAIMSGISTRTLRYYDQIGLLSPGRVASNGYRIYGPAQVDLLQQILFFRELGFELDTIKRIVGAPDFDCDGRSMPSCGSPEARERSGRSLQTLKDDPYQKGETVMSDEEKFKGFKQKLIDENERNYGAEVREKYGEAAADAANAKLKGMTKEQYDAMEKLSEEVNETLRAAFAEGDPAGELAQKACDLHRQWLCLHWPEGMYSKQAHLNMAEMYCADERFKAYYDAITPGCTEFLRDALAIYCK